MPSHSARRAGSSGFEHRFEGADVLDGLLELAGSPFDAHGVFTRFVGGLQASQRAQEVIPTLFEGEPRFPNPEIARRLYQNLLGLWDKVASGERFDLHPAGRPKRIKRQKPRPPPPFGPEGPDTAFVEAAWRYLEALPEGDPRTLERLHHAFENRNDALLQSLDEAGLDDEKYATIRYLWFEIFAMLELGSGPTAGPNRGTLPEALRAYMDEALFESDLGDDAALRALAENGVQQLWAASGRGEGRT